MQGTASTPPWFLLSRRKPPEAIQILMRRARRNPLNWVGPVVAIFATLAIPNMLYHGSIGGLLPFLLLDHLLFLAALASSSRLGSEWRRRRIVVDEMLLAGLPRDQIVMIPVYEQLAVWRWAIWLFVPGILVTVGLATWQHSSSKNEALGTAALAIFPAATAAMLAYFTVILALSMSADAGSVSEEKSGGKRLELCLQSVYYLIALTLGGGFLLLIAALMGAVVVFEYSALRMPRFSLIAALVLSGVIIPICCFAPICWLKLQLAAFHLRVARKQLFGEGEKEI